MLHQCKAEVTIRRVGNGFIVEWEYEKPKSSKFSRLREPDDESWRDPSGVEVFKTEAEAIKCAEKALNKAL